MAPYLLAEEWLKQQQDLAYAEGRLREFEHKLDSQAQESQSARVAFVEQQKQVVESLKLSISETTHRLAKSPEAQSYTVEKQANLVQQLTEIIKQLSPENAYACLTLNQGLVFEDALFGRIYGMLMAAIKGEVNTCEIPKLQRSTASTFNETGLREYLVSLNSELQSCQLTFFPELYEYIESKKEALFSFAPPLSN